VFLEIQCHCNARIENLDRFLPLIDLVDLENAIAVAFGQVVEILGLGPPGPGGMTNQARLVPPLDVIPLILTSRFTTFVARSFVCGRGSFRRNGFISRMSMYGFFFNSATSPSTVAPANSAPTAKIKDLLAMFIVTLSLVPATVTNLAHTS